MKCLFQIVRPDMHVTTILANSVDGAASQNTFDRWLVAEQMTLLCSLSKNTELDLYFLL